MADDVTNPDPMTVDKAIETLRGALPGQLDADPETFYAAVVKLAEGLAQSALEAIRSKRQVLSALQSVSAALREEIHLAKYDPQG